MPAFFAWLELFVSLLKVAAWPIIGAYLIYQFGPPVRDFLEDLSELRFFGAGVEARAVREADAAAYAGAAVGSKRGDSTDSVPKEIRKLSRLLSEHGGTTLGGRSLLWVDDQPENNSYEREALEALGISVETCTSTDEALDQLSQREYDVVISDMGRPESDRAGYNLLEEKQESGDRTPFVIYSGSNKPEHKREARRRGAVGATAIPTELFRLVREALGRSTRT
ncbi:Response regulator receiver domain-containing protein [Halogranum rubrum]|uniref:Response regulator receiver domain-containing protein n=1 Tax=Halogranum rubrum TaxID=553466 RepID=A0A1I4H8S0_9EURY|nr:response regulator [Halogranum rubrum]SFL37811.1 Response regulator receiver domain-containing protein [Halogranum rubrum]